METFIKSTTIVKTEIIRSSTTNETVIIKTMSGQPSKKDMDKIFVKASIIIEF